MVIAQLAQFGHGKMAWMAPSASLGCPCQHRHRLERGSSGAEIIDSLAGSICSPPPRIAHTRSTKSWATLLVAKPDTEVRDDASGETATIISHITPVGAKHLSRPGFFSRGSRAIEGGVRSTDWTGKANGAGEYDPRRVLG